MIPDLLDESELGGSFDGCGFGFDSEPVGDGDEAAAHGGFGDVMVGGKSGDGGAVGEVLEEPNFSCGEGFGDGMPVGGGVGDAAGDVGGEDGVIVGGGFDDRWQVLGWRVGGCNAVGTMVEGGKNLGGGEVGEEGDDGEVAGGGKLGEEIPVSMFGEVEEQDPSTGTGGPPVEIVGAGRRVTVVGQVVEDAFCVVGGGMVNCDRDGVGGAH